MTIRCYIDADEPQSVRDMAKSIGFDEIIGAEDFTRFLEVLHLGDRFMLPVQKFDGGEFVRVGNGHDKWHNLAAFIRS